MFKLKSRLLRPRRGRRHHDSLTTFLFARPSFLGGMARALDLGNTLNEYNQSLSPEEADTLALRSDFRAVGRDFRAAIDQVTREPDVRRALERAGKSRRQTSRRKAVRAS